MVSQLIRTNTVTTDFDYIKDIYEVCLNRYLDNKIITFSSINNGRKILQSEEEVDAYIAFYGAQHYHKLIEAFKELDILKLGNQQLDILSYGCGAATDTCSLISYCRAQQIDLPFKNLTLIEPSPVALERGIKYINEALSSQESKTIKIKPLNKYFHQLTDQDIDDESQNLKLHVFSNILDIEEINLDNIVNLIIRNYRKPNYFLCISPKKYNGQARIDEFYNKISSQINCSTIHINNQDFLRRIYLIKDKKYIDNFNIDRYHRIFKTN